MEEMNHRIQMPGKKRGIRMYWGKKEREREKG